MDTIPTNLLAGTNAWIGTNNFNTNLPSSTLAPTVGGQLCKKTYVDSVAGSTLLPANNTWTGTNQYTTEPPVTPIDPTALN